MESIVRMMQKRARIVPVKKQPFKSKITLLIMKSVDTDLEEGRCSCRRPHRSCE
jgi:hypothetical protein